MSHWCQYLCPRASEPLNCATALDFLHRIRPCTADCWKHSSSHRRLLDCPLIAWEKNKIFKYIANSHSRAVNIYWIYSRETNRLEQDIFSSFAFCKFNIIFSNFFCFFFQVTWLHESAPIVNFLLFVQSMSLNRKKI